MGHPTTKTENCRLIGIFVRGQLRKFLTLYYVIIYPIIAFLVIYFLISGGSFNLVWVETGAWGGLSLTFRVFLMTFWNTYSHGHSLSYDY